MYSIGQAVKYQGDVYYVVHGPMLDAKGESYEISMTPPSITVNATNLSAKNGQRFAGAPLEGLPNLYPDRVSPETPHSCPRCRGSLLAVTGDLSVHDSKQTGVRRPEQ
jgi:hypothetical protein